MAKFVLISFKWVRRPLVHQQEMMKWAERVVNIQKGRCFTKRLISARKFFKPCFKSCYQKGGYAICITNKSKKQEKILNIQIVSKAGPRPRYNLLAIQESSIGQLVSDLHFDFSNFTEHCRAVVDTCDLPDKLRNLTHDIEGLWLTLREWPGQRSQFLQCSSRKLCPMETNGWSLIITSRLQQLQMVFSEVQRLKISSVLLQPCVPKKETQRMWMAESAQTKPQWESSSNTSKPPGTHCPGESLGQR